MNSEIQPIPNRMWEQRSAILAFFRLLRPKQWSKNALVFSALLFSFNLVGIEKIYVTVAGFAIFCAVSSCVYILNDFADREADRNHPVKRHRPLASGAVSPAFALVACGVILGASLFASYSMNARFGALVTAYFLMNVLYSYKLKHIVIIDIMVIALGFVLRAIGGGLLIDVPITPWFLLCIMLLALFLAIGKRRHEIVLSQSAPAGVAHRKVLAFYTLPLLDQMTNMMTSAIILSYCLFTFTSDQTEYMMLTIPFVIYGMFRYLYLIHVEKKGGAPDELLFEDKHILLTVVGYVITSLIVMYAL